MRHRLRGRQLSRDSEHRVALRRNLAKGGLTFQNDFAFVVDQTGSMGDDIAAVKAAANGVIDALFADNKIDARVGVVGFRDNTVGEPTTVILPFTDQARRYGNDARNDATIARRRSSPSTPALGTA